VELDPLGLVDRVTVDADDHALALLDLALPAERGLLDLLLHPAGLDRGHRAAELVNTGDQLGRLGLELVGEGLDVPRPAERVGGARRASLVHQDLLRPQRERRGALRG
jgi:hypothetical protein